MSDEIKPNDASQSAETQTPSTGLVALDDWDCFERIALNNRTLEKNLVISAMRKDPAYKAFDILRTRMLQTIGEKGWHRIGITSPTDGCGKTFVAANLAISLARGETNRVLLMDMNLRKPDMARVLGIQRSISMADYLSGIIDPEEFFLRLGPSLVAGLNSKQTKDVAELVQTDMTADVLDEIQDILAPDVTIFDLPPMLSSDDAMACLPHLDAVLLVVGGGMTTEAEIRDAERLLQDQTPLLGVILNNAED